MQLQAETLYTSHYFDWRLMKQQSTSNNLILFFQTRNIQWNKLNTDYLIEKFEKISTCD